ncbi:probable protein phosphatase 2C 41 [Herrania umbratica]|uniref:protein-serine/threonine phosphatase n=1 Tax=Herrania umbratica TaxID=108875 RepID=A0A6J1ATI1_9ROSI|nr:probable protein phosphatase 2C 41 [Herrania umbratica]XP_021290532.1 probable protein phosphatase 2C 41 [Herrania umbratica]
MVLIPSFLDGLARTVSIKKGRNGGQTDVGREAAETMAKDAKKNELMRSSSGTVKSIKSSNFASVCSKRGQKGINQDCAVVWEEFGCQEDMIFCGIFDGHGPWGHVVAKRVRESVPSSLLCNWQKNLALTSLGQELDMEVLNRSIHQFDVWKQSCLQTYADIDLELKQHPGIDSFRSGTTALTIIKQGEHLVIANVGDSRAVLATTSDDGNLVPLQLTVDFKPNIPEEAERITQSKGLVFCLRDEPGVYRVWMPNGNTPGLALSRAFGDYCVKEFGLISVPDVTQRNITGRDQFVILATDGVWDVVSNQEAVEIVSSAEDREKSAKKLVQCAIRAWKYKKRGIAMDDMSAICLFFHPTLSREVNLVKASKKAGMKKLA